MLEALSVKLFANPSYDSSDDLRQIHAAEYVAADLLRAGCQETGFARLRNTQTVLILLAIEKSWPRLRSGSLSKETERLGICCSRQRFTWL